MSASLQQIWRDFLETQAPALPAKIYSTFLAPSRVAIENDALSIFVKSSAAQSWLLRYFQPQFGELLGLLNDQGFPLTRWNLYVSPDISLPQADDAPEEEGSAANEGITPNGGARAPMTFDNFVIGKANELAFLSCRNLVNEQSGSAFQNPLYLYGNSGTGKTHLLRAICHEYKKTNGAGNKVGFITGNDFMKEVVSAYRQDAANAFKEKFYAYHLLCIDDIQYIGGDKKRTQEEFFFLFNFLMEENKILALSSDTIPYEIDGLPTRLRNRLSSGLSILISPPEYELRVSILYKKAEELGFSLPENVANFIADNIRSSVREIEGSLRRVIAHTRFTQKPVDIDLCRQALADMLRPSLTRRASIQKIQKTVAQYFEITVKDITSKRRSQQIAYPRQIAMYLAREMTDLSLPEIGEQFGGRNHTTVIHGHKKIAELLKRDEETAQVINLIRAKIQDR